MESIKFNRIIRNKDEIAIIKTSKGDEILVDDENFIKLNDHTWGLNHGYAITTINGKGILMHRFLMNAKGDEIIDHINHNKVDNRVSNLRKSNHTNNSHNRTKIQNKTSKYVGVYKTGDRFAAKIAKDCVKYHLGSYETEEDAAKEYNKKALELYGDFANLNDIKEISLKPQEGMILPKHLIVNGVIKL